MSKAIYKVTSKKITKILEIELKRKDKYMPSIVCKVKKFMAGVQTVSYREDSWDGKIKPSALVFTEEFESILDLKKWKHIGDVYVKDRWYKSYWPKVNTKAGKELAKSLRDLMPSEAFFQNDEILTSVGYKPKKQVDQVARNRISVNTFGVGYKKSKTGITFIFQGYKGYKPPKGVKEMLTSEHNKMFGV